MLKFEFSIVVDDETYKIGDIVTISLYDTMNQYDYLYQDEDKTYEKICTAYRGIDNRRNDNRLFRKISVLYNNAEI